MDDRYNVMLKTREVASLLNVHINTVRRWSNAGILKVYRVGPRGDRRYDKRDIDYFLQNADSSNMGIPLADNYQGTLKAADKESSWIN